MPHVVGVMPHVVCVMPHVVGVMPHVVCVMPHVVGVMPHVVGVMPHVVRVQLLNRLPDSSLHLLVAHTTVSIEHSKEYNLTLKVGI